MTGPVGTGKGEGAGYYRAHLFCCVNERPDGHARGCCKAKGGVRLRNYMKARVKELGLDGVRVNQAGCLDRCEEGPVCVVYPEGIWYTYVDESDIDEIIDSHLINGKPVDRLKI